MRSLVTAAALGTALLAVIPAIGATAVVVDADRKIESAVLRADATTGRAWVEVTLARRFLNGKEARKPGTAINVAVPELTFDRATNRVSIGTGDNAVTCATLEGELRETGACRIDAGIEPQATRDRLVVAVVAR